MNTPHFAQQVTFLFCDALSVARDFYGDKLGLEEVLDQGSCAIFRVSGDAFVGLCERAVPDESSCIFTFVVDDVDGTYEWMIEQGIRCEHAPKLNEKYSIYHFFADDPFGNRLEFQRFEDPRWPGSASR